MNPNENISFPTAISGLSDLALQWCIEYTNGAVTGGTCNIYRAVGAAYRLYLAAVALENKMREAEAFCSEAPFKKKKRLTLLAFAEMLDEKAQNLFFIR
jgi:hypothetical protein